jgi:hypothetical protein
VGFREAGEDQEDANPEDEEEEDDEEDDLVGPCVGGRPEILPIAAVVGGEEGALEEGGDEEPLRRRVSLVG